MPKDAWKAMSPAKQWYTNKLFLDAAIKRGDEFLLASKVSDVVPKDSFGRELRYMFAKGYKVSKDGLRLLKY